MRLNEKHSGGFQKARNILVFDFDTVRNVYIFVVRWEKI